MKRSGGGLYSGRGVLFYDAACGFCRWCVAKILAWDRDQRIVPLAIRSSESAALLADVEPERRLASWHFLSRDPWSVARWQRLVLHLAEVLPELLPA
jgi:predicted DCC family thiol-disulfide oxidoreductase YuxK